MARSTKGYIPRNNVSIEEIIKVLNSDGGTLKADNLDIREIFDQLKSSRKGNLYGKFVNGDGKPNTAPATRDIATDYTFIDPQVPGDTDEAKLSNVKDTGSYDLGDLRGYGGSEASADELPEIYWANIINKLDNECALSGEALTDFKNTFNEPNTPIITITSYPNLEEASNVIDASKLINNNLVSDGAYLLHSLGENETLNQSDLATKVGIDYPGTPPGLPRFSIRVTPYINYASLPYFEEGGDKFYKFNVLDGSPALGAAVSFAAAAEVMIKSGGIVDLCLERAMAAEVGNLAPTIHELEVIRSLWGTGLQTGTEFFATFTAVLTAFAIVYAIIAIADMIWDFLHKPLNISDALYQYSQAVLGNYGFSDILNSTYSIGAGNKFYITDQGVNETEGDNIYVSQEGNLHEFTLDTPNYGEVFDKITNLITRFPNKPTNREKYLNFKFNPRAIQYDMSIPPPVVEYLVELVPIQNCKLSETKPTKFIVQIAPTKYEAPIFSIDTTIKELIQPDLEPGDNPRRSRIPNTAATNNIIIPKYYLYKNSSISFKNAKYVDFILLKDLVIDDEFIGLGGQYRNITINRDGNLYPYIHQFYKKSGTFYKELQGENLNGNYEDFVNPNGGLYMEGGEYEVFFMQEKEKNKIFNPFFRVERDDKTARRYAELKKFWNYDEGLEIRTGAIYKDFVTTTPLHLWQNMWLRESSTWKSRYYTLNITVKINSGMLYIDHHNSSFAPNIYDAYTNWGAMDLITGHREPVLNPAEYGVSYLPEGIAISESGTYYLVLKTDDDIEEGKLQFKFSENFTGNMSKCLLQYLPRERAGSPESYGFNLFGKQVVLFDNTGRGAKNAVTYSDKTYSNKFMFVDKYITEKTLILRNSINLANESGTIELKLLPHFKATISIRNADTKELTQMLTADDYVTEGTYDITFDTNWFGNGRENIDRFIIKVTSVSETPGSVWLKSITSHYKCITGLEDDRGLLLDSEVDLSGTSYGTYIYGEPRGSLKDFPTTLSKLNLSDTPLEENVGSVKYITGYSAASVYYRPISDVIEYLNLSNTSMYGDLSNVLLAKELVLVNTGINKYISGYPQYDSLDTPIITWKNSNIDIDSLNKLLLDLDSTAAENGTLDIAGNNPEITDETALKAIDSLISKGWNILYNGITIPVITLVGDNPLTWTLGETFVDPGATAYDDKDGDITESIVVTDNIDINTEGTYQVTYNVTDSDGNSAEEVVRTVVVEESSFTPEEVTIGTQTWTAVNLDIDDGGEGIYAYNNDENNVPIYGRLYTWDAAMRVAASIDGWHLPTDAEWTTLVGYLGGLSVAGGKLKEAGTTHWRSPNTGATNETGFTALPGGYRNSGGAFSSVGRYGYWWSATEASATGAWDRYMRYNYSNVVRSYSNKVVGYSVRLIKDQP